MPFLLALATTVAFYGSSTTYGVGASRPERRYSSMLCKMLGWQELNAGLSGATVASESPGDLRAVERWKQDVVAHHPDRIIAMLGANDAARDLAVDSFQANLGLLIDALPSTFAHKNLALVTAQPGKANAAHRAPFDKALLETAKRIGALGIDARRAFGETELPALAADDIHMNDLGHSLVASCLAAGLVDGGWAPKVGPSHGGSWAKGAAKRLPGGKWLVSGTLSAGELRSVRLELGTAAQVRVGVVRPLDHGGFQRLYRTMPLDMPMGPARVVFPRWRVQAGDRLAVWSNQAALLGTTGSCLAFPADARGELPDLTGGQVLNALPRLVAR
jgi:lysophospholipase L1-like esterase